MMNRRIFEIIQGWKNVKAKSTEHCRGKEINTCKQKRIGRADL